MLEFWAALGSHAFLQNALAGGLLASVACGVMGSFVVAKRISYLAGAMAHSVLGGMGLARYLQTVHGLEWFSPLLGAVLAALLSAALVGLASLKAKEREDTVIGAIWAVGMALGLLFISRTPGYATDLMSYLFGNILMIGPDQLWLLLGLDAFILAVVALCYPQLLAVCFDEEFARLRGVPTQGYYLLLLGLVGLSTVLLSAVVGLVMVIALLTLPAAAAGGFFRRLGSGIIASVLLTSLVTTLGLAFSYGPDLPPGACIILLAGLAYLLSLLGRRWLSARGRA